MQAWLDNGADVDLGGQNGITPLHAACGNGHVDVARLLLEKGAMVDWRDSDGRTPLFAAAKWGHVGTARLLLKAGADARREDNRKWTPGSVAACHTCGDNHAVMALLEQYS